MIEYKTHEFTPSLVDFSKEPETVGNMLENIVNNVLSGNKLATVGRCKASFSDIKEPTEVGQLNVVTIPASITFKDASGKKVSSGKIVLNGTMKSGSRYNIHDVKIVLDKPSLMKLKKKCTKPLKPDDIGMRKGATLNLKHDQYGDQYHLWRTKKGKNVDSIECQPHGGNDGGMACWFYEPLTIVEKGIFTGLREPTIPDLSISKYSVSSLDTVILEGIGKKNVECELREYQHDPENMRWMQYVCKIK